MKLAEAADVWVEAKKQIDDARPRLEAAAEVLKEHFRKTNRRHYKQRIGFAVTVRRQLDTKKVREELGDRLPDFQKSQRYETLSLLEE